MLQAEVSCYEKSPDTLSVEVFRLVAAPRVGRGVLLSHTLPGWPCRDPHTAPGCRPGPPRFAQAPATPEKPPSIMVLLGKGTHEQPRHRGKAPHC